MEAMYIYWAIGMVVTLIQIYFHITTSPNYDPNDDRNFGAFIFGMLINPFIYPLTVVTDIAEAKRRKEANDTDRL